VKELYISFGPKWAPNKWFWTLFMTSEVWENWISITGGAGTAFPCVQWHFHHWLSVCLSVCLSGRHFRATIGSSSMAHMKRYRKHSTSNCQTEKMTDFLLLLKKMQQRSISAWSKRQFWSLWNRGSRL